MTSMIPIAATRLEVPAIRGIAIEHAGYTTKFASAFNRPFANRAHTREFRSILRDVRKLRDWMGERSEFELPVPLSKLSDDSVVL
jgi:hypothetical protein